MRPLTLALLLVVVTGCATNAAPPCASPSFAGQIETLAFGTDRPDGEPVSAAEWESFLAAEVTPRFPEGLTWWSASGQWRGADGTVVKEGTYLVQLVGAHSAGRDAAVRAVIDAYRSRFAQEAVMHLRQSACVSF